jgi:hypothetical protein
MTPDGRDTVTTHSQSENIHQNAACARSHHDVRDARTKFPDCLLLRLRKGEGDGQNYLHDFSWTVHAIGSKDVQTSS